MTFRDKSLFLHLLTQILGNIKFFRHRHDVSWLFVAHLKIMHCFKILEMNLDFMITSQMKNVLQSTILALLRCHHYFKNDIRANQVCWLPII